MKRIIKNKNVEFIVDSEYLTIVRNTIKHNISFINDTVVREYPNKGSNKLFVCTIVPSINSIYEKILYDLDRDGFKIEERKDGHVKRYYITKK